MNQVSEETLEMFEDYHSNSGMENYFSFKMYHSDKLKFTAETGIVKIVKVNPVIIESENKITLCDIVIMINDEVFIRLPEEVQKLVVEKTFCMIGFDSEKDKITLLKPNYQEFVGMRIKHGDSLLESANISMKSIYEAVLEEQKANKPAKGKKN